jgi:hypothetical protein
MGCPDALQPFLASQLPQATVVPAASEGTLAQPLVNLDVLLQLLLANHWSRAAGGAARLAVLFASVDSEGDGRIGRRQFQRAMQAAAAVAAAGVAAGGQGSRVKVAAVVPADGRFGREQLGLMWQESVALSGQQAQGAQGAAQALQRGSQPAGDGKRKMRAGRAPGGAAAAGAAGSGAEGEGEEGLASVQGFVLAARRHGLGSWAAAGATGGALPAGAWLPGSWQQQHRPESPCTAAAEQDVSAAAAAAAAAGSSAGGPPPPVLPCSSRMGCVASTSAFAATAAAGFPQPGPIPGGKRPARREEEALEGLAVPALLPEQGLLQHALQGLQPSLGVRLAVAQQRVSGEPQLLLPLVQHKRHCEALLQAAADAHAAGQGGSSGGASAATPAAAAELAAWLALLVLVQQVDAALGSLAQPRPAEEQAADSGGSLKGALSSRLLSLSLPKQAGGRSASGPGRAGSTTALPLGSEAAAVGEQQQQQHMVTPCVIHRLGGHGH